MNLVKFDPFRELEEMNTRLGRLFGQRPNGREGFDEDDMFSGWAPAVDIEETDQEFLVKADLPDVKKDDVKVRIDEGVLTVEGERKQEREEKNRKFHRIERHYGKFIRRLALPIEVDAQKVAADFKNGVLNVHLPKSAQAKPKGVEVRVS